MTQESKTTSKNDKIKIDVRHEPDPAVDPEEYGVRIEKAFVRLLMTEPFLGAISMQIAKRPDWSCDTAYVAVNSKTGDLCMGYNPDFMSKLTDEQKIGVFVHELYHLVFTHVTNRSMRTPRVAKLWNVATDLAINSLIKRSSLPDFALVPGEAPLNCDDQEVSDLIKSFPKEQVADWYMDRLREFSEEKKKEDGEGGLDVELGSMDSHDGWGEIPEEMDDFVRETVRGVMEKAVQVAQTQNWGSVPQSAQTAIAELLKREIDWKAVLRQFVGRVRSSERETTLKKYNKKNGELTDPNALWAFPGAKRILHSRLLFAIDQSGSMSDENVQRGLAEGLSCSLEGEIDIINFDTEVDLDSLRTVKKGKGFKWERTRCGGTDFDCVRRFVSLPTNRGKWQGIVVVTDGYAATMGFCPGVRFLWLITPDGTLDAVRAGDLVVQMDKGKKRFDRK